MTPMQNNSNQNMSMHQKYDMGRRIAHNFCGIFTTPLEYALRPHFGSRYFDPILLAFTLLFMMVLPLASTGASHLPFGGTPPKSDGLIGLGTLSFIFFTGQLFHGPRIWWRMTHMESEEHSQYEGDALPFFAFLPFGKDFWTVRIFWEPLFVTVLAVALHAVHLMDREAMGFLVTTSLLLVFKNHLSWYQSWLQLRILMDAKFAGPLMAKAASGNATEKELARVHMAGFRTSVPADIRIAALSEMAPLRPTLPPDLAHLVSPVETSRQSV